MQLIIALAAFTLAQAGSLDRAYLPSNSRGAGASDNSFQTQNFFGGNQGLGIINYQERPERPQAALERNAAILRQESVNDGESYAYSYETENGISADENGVATNGVRAQGGFAYTGDDGKIYSIRYTANENGFLPQGDHLPTSPPIPEEILRALEKNARDEAAGIRDDGSYAEGKYGGVSNEYLPPSEQNSNQGY